MQRHVTENHSQQVRDCADGVVRGLGRVSRLLGKRFQHSSGKSIVDHALHEHQRQRVSELFVLRTVRASGDLFLENPVEEITHEYAGGADGEFRPFVHDCL